MLSKEEDKKRVLNRLEKEFPNLSPTAKRLIASEAYEAGYRRREKERNHEPCPRTIMDRR